MKRRIISAILCTSMVVSLLAGCGKTASVTEEAQTSDDATSKIEDTIEIAQNSNAEDPLLYATGIDASKVDDSSNMTSEGKTKIHVSLDMDPGTFDPALFGSVLGLEATSYCYREGLFERNTKGELFPVIAKGYTVDDDNLTYHIELFEGVTDSQGNPITADDVVFCYERAKENGFNSTSYYDEVTADDDLHVTIKLNDSSEGIFEQVVQVILLYSKEFYDSVGSDFGTTAETSCFSGPYVLTNWTAGTSLTFEKNENYWQKDAAALADNVYSAQNVDIVEFDVVGESTQLSIGLESGTLDLVGNIGYTDAQQFIDKEGFTVTEWEDLLTQVLYLNMDPTSPFYDNLPLREAVMYGIDIDEMIDACVNGYGVAAKTFGNNMMPDYQEKWDNEAYFDYDLDYAKEKYTESGYTGTLKIMCNNSNLHILMATVLQGYLAQVGINSEILSYDGSLFQTYKYDPAQYDICIDQCAWSGPSVTKLRDQFDEKNAQGCQNSITDEEFMNKLYAAMNVDTYSDATVDDFYQYLKDQCYARGLFNQINFAIAKDVVTGVRIHRSGNLHPTGSTYVWNE